MTVAFTAPSRNPAIPAPWGAANPTAPEVSISFFVSPAAYEEALDNIRDAIRLHVEDRIEAGEEILPPESISLTSVSAWP